MTIKKIIITFIFISFITTMSFSQNEKPKYFYEITLNKGVGFKDLSINYRRLTLPTSQDVYYSLGAGGGIGAVAGISLPQNFGLSIGGNSQLVFINKSEKVSGIKNRSRASLFRNNISFNVNYYLTISHESTVLQSIGFSAGYDYYLPSTLKREINKVQQDNIKYKSTHGFHLGSNFHIPLSKQTFLILGFKYRYAIFKSKNSLIDDVHNEVNGQGIDFKIGIRGKF